MRTLGPRLPKMSPRFSLESRLSQTRDTRDSWTKLDSPPDLPLYLTRLMATGTPLLLIGFGNKPIRVEATLSRRRHLRGRTADSMFKTCLVQHTKPARGLLEVDPLILQLSRRTA